MLKEKKRKGKLRGFGPKEGVWSAISQAHYASACLTFLDLLCVRWPGSMVVLQLWPLDLGLKPLGVWISEAYGGSRVGCCIWICEEKLNKCFGGPGIRTQVPRDNASTCLPTQPARSFVNGIPNNYYMEKHVTMPGKKIKRRADSNRRTRWQHVIIFNLGPAKNIIR